MTMYFPKNTLKKLNALNKITMEKNEIKKALYKQKKQAQLLVIKSGFACYETSLDDGTVVFFEVPVSDMGNADFLPVMEAQLLNRWIKLSNP